MKDAAGDPLGQTHSHWWETFLEQLHEDSAAEIPGFGLEPIISAVGPKAPESYRLSKFTSLSPSSKWMSPLFYPEIYIYSSGEFPEHSGEQWCLGRAVRRQDMILLCSGYYVITKSSWIWSFSVVFLVGLFFFMRYFYSPSFSSIWS